MQSARVGASLTKLACRLHCPALPAIAAGDQYSTIVSRRGTYPIRSSPRRLLVLLVPELLCLRADADAVADLLDAHVPQMSLVHLEQVLAVDVVVYRGQCEEAGENKNDIRLNKSTY